MKIYLFITIDTEEDLWGGFTIKKPPVENIKNIPLIQDVFEKYCAIPTYLINYPVASNDFSINLLKDLIGKKQCEIGTHCHPWNTPPFVEKINEINSFLCNLPEDLVNLKIMKLHNVIVENFNLKPLSFRAGRWGIGYNVLETLKKLDYKIDTSITPFVNWGKYSGPNFNSMINTIHGVNKMKYLCTKAKHCVSCDKRNECIVEIPPTIGFFQKNFNACNKIRNFLLKKPFSNFGLIGILDRLGFLNFRWLSPELSEYEDMVNLTKSFIQQGHRFLNMSFHSTSLLPGKSPFVQNKKDLKNFISKIEKYLKFAKSSQISCIGVSSALEIIS